MNKDDLVNKIAGKNPLLGKFINFGKACEKAYASAFGADWESKAQATLTEQEKTIIRLNEQQLMQKGAPMLMNIFKKHYSNQEIMPMLQHALQLLEAGLMGLLRTQDQAAIIRATPWQQLDDEMRGVLAQYGGSNLKTLLAAADNMASNMPATAPTPKI